jgi:hypothetical protein
VISPLARFLAVVVALLGLVAVVVVFVLALTSDDPLNILAIPVVALGAVGLVAAVLLFGVMAQGVRNLRREPDE